MFTKVKNIDTAFQHIRLFSLFFLGTCAITTCLVNWNALSLVRQSEQHIYILANGKILEAFSGDRKDNIPVEARDHINMFHHYFFTLDPDEKVITGNLAKSLYLADGSAKKQYDNLRENGYYRNIISANISQELETDFDHAEYDQLPLLLSLRGQREIDTPYDNHRYQKPGHRRLLPAATLPVPTTTLTAS